MTCSWFVLLFYSFLLPAGGVYRFEEESEPLMKVDHLSGHFARPSAVTEQSSILNLAAESGHSDLPPVSGCKVAVVPGNTINVPLGDDAPKSREKALSLASAIMDKHGKEFGFDGETMVLKAPQTPFKNKTTKEHWPDMGAHVTVAMAQWKDVVTKEMGDKAHPQVDLTFVEDAVKLMIGNPENDEAVGGCIYVAAMISDTCKKEMLDIRTFYDLPAPPPDKEFHVSLAVIAPKDNDFGAVSARSTIFHSFHLSLASILRLSCVWSRQALRARRARLWGVRGRRLRSLSVLRL